MLHVRRDLSDLFSEFNRAQEEINRLFGMRSGVASAPLINLWQDDHAVYAEADLPGFDPAELEIFVTEGNQLTIQGERAVPTANGSVWVRQERPFGKFSRIVGLPVLVDADKVEAKYEYGVLKLTLPKSEAAKPRKIQVQA